MLYLRVIDWRYSKHKSKAMFYYIIDFDMKILSSQPCARLVRGGWHQTDKHQLETELCMLYPHTPHIRRQLDGFRPNTYSRSGYCISFHMECILYLAIVHSTKHSQPWKLTQNFISISLVINYNKIKLDLNTFNSNLILSFLLFCIRFTSLKKGTIWILNS